MGDLIAFGRIVVHIHHVVRRNVEMGGDLRERLALGIPAHAHGRKVVPSKHHVIVRSKNLLDIGWIVLARDGENHAPLAETPHGTLKVDKGAARILGTQGNALRTLFTDHAAPESVVQIENETLLSFAGEGTEELQIFAAKFRQCASRDGSPCVEGHTVVVPGKGTGALHESCIVDRMNSPRLSAYAAEISVERGHEIGLGRCRLSVQDAQTTPGGRGEVVNEKGRRRALAEGLGEVRELARGFDYRRIEIGRVGDVVAVEIRYKVFALQSQNNCVRGEGIEAAVAVQDFLSELTETGLIEFDA